MLAITCKIGEWFAVGKLRVTITARTEVGVVMQVDHIALAGDVFLALLGFEVGETRIIAEGVRVFLKKRGVRYVHLAVDAPKSMRIERGEGVKA